MNEEIERREKLGDSRLYEGWNALKVTSNGTAYYPLKRACVSCVCLENDGHYNPQIILRISVAMRA